MGGNLLPDTSALALPPALSIIGNTVPLECGYGWPDTSSDSLCYRAADMMHAFSTCKPGGKQQCAAVVIRFFSSRCVRSMRMEPPRIVCCGYSSMSTA